MDEGIPPESLSPAARTHPARPRLLQQELGTDGMPRAPALRTTPAPSPGDDGSRHRPDHRAGTHGEV